MRSGGDWFLSIVHYQFDELKAAEQCFARVIKNRFIAQAVIVSSESTGAGKLSPEQKNCKYFFYADSAANAKDGSTQQGFRPFSFLNSGFLHL